LRAVSVALIGRRLGAVSDTQAVARLADASLRRGVCGVVSAAWCQARGGVAGSVGGVGRVSGCLTRRCQRRDVSGVSVVVSDVRVFWGAEARSWGNRRQGAHHKGACLPSSFRERRAPLLLMETPRHG
jgi:hypothetical protein